MPVIPQPPTSSATNTAATNLNLTAGSGKNIAFSGAGNLNSNGGNVTLSTSGAGVITSGTAAGKDVMPSTGVQKGEPIEIEEPITVKSLSATLGVKSNDIIKKLMSQGVFANVNQALDTDTAQAIALEYGIELTIAQQQTSASTMVRCWNAA